MPAERKKIQSRRCQACDKMGHNRATCKEIPTTLAEQVVVAKKTTTTTALPKNKTKSKTTFTTAAPLKFFVHHVNYASEHSPHVVNLKKKTEHLWNKVESSAPEHTNSLYHSYHETTAQEDTSAPAIFSIPTNFIDNTQPSLIDKIRTIITTWHANQAKPENIFSINLSNTTTAPLQFAVNEPVIKPSKKPITWHRDAIEALKAVFPTRRFVSAVVLLLVAITIPGPAFGYYESMVTTKQTLVKNSTDAFIALQNSTKALKQADLVKAAASTNDALNKFNKALATIEDHQFIETVTSIIPTFGNSITSRQKILLAGQEITVGNSYLLQGLAAAQKKETTFTGRLQIVLNTIHDALPNYQKAKDNLETVDSTAVPVEYQAQFNEFKQILGTLVHDFTTIDQLGSSFLDIFGGKGNRRYLLVFQNPHEMRATGGFMGSFAIMDIKDGEITKLDVPAGGTYDLQGQLKKFVQPPTPLLLSNKRWEFQDANWFPDFPTTAEKILWFYRNSYGVTADGVIAINATVLERLLTVLGPIADDKRSVTLDAINVIPTLQKIVEEGPEKKTNKPKQIIADLAPTLLGNIKNANTNTLLPLLTQLQEAVEQKEIQAYFTDDTTEASIKHLGWSGAVLPTTPTQDYLLVVNSNIQGQKSDAMIQQAISHQAVVSADGSVFNTVTITREHTGTADTTLYGHVNIDYLRVYVPEGSELVNASGFTWPDEKAFRAPEKWYTADSLLSETELEQGIDQKSGTRITHEFNKTAFGNWIITEPGTTSQVTFTYRLPFKLNSETTKISSWQKILSPLEQSLMQYQLVVQKQSGVKTSFDSQIIFPDTWKPYWQDGVNMALATNGARITPSELVKDSIWSLMMRD